MYKTDAFWLVPEEGRSAFRKGVRTGVVATAGVVGALALAPVFLTTVPAFGLYYLGTFAATVLVGASYDSSNTLSSVEVPLGAAVAKKPALMGAAKGTLYRKGLARGILRTMKGLGINALIAPVAPLLLPVSYMIDKGTNGRKWFSWKPSRSPQATKEQETEVRRAFLQDTSPVAKEFQKRSLTKDFKSALQALPAPDTKQGSKPVQNFKRRP